MPQSSIHRRSGIIVLLLFLFLGLCLRIGAGIFEDDRRLAFDILRDPEDRSLQRLLHGIFVIAVAEVLYGAGIGECADVGPMGAELRDPPQRNFRIVLAEMQQRRHLALFAVVGDGLAAVIADHAGDAADLVGGGVGEVATPAIA